MSEEPMCIRAMRAEDEDERLCDQYGLPLCVVDMNGLTHYPTAGQVVTAYDIAIQRAETAEKKLREIDEFERDMNEANRTPLSADDEARIEKGLAAIKLVSENQRLTRELAAAQKDTERLDWLETQVIVEKEPEPYFPIAIWRGWQISGYNETLRDRIDEVLPEKKNE